MMGPEVAGQRVTHDRRRPDEKSAAFSHQARDRNWRRDADAEIRAEDGRKRHLHPHFATCCHIQIRTQI